MLLQLHAASTNTAPVASGPPESPKGTIFLSTRGYARTSVDNNNKGVEAATLHRQEFPYGAAAGWKWVYQGFSDGAKDTINIKGAGVWIQQTPDDALVRLPLTFNGGSSQAVIPKEGLQETDPIRLKLNPAPLYGVTTWYSAGDKNTGLPFQTLLCIRESKPGLEDQDGAAVGPPAHFQITR